MGLYVIFHESQKELASRIFGSSSTISLQFENLSMALWPLRSYSQKGNVKDALSREGLAFNAALCSRGGGLTLWRLAVRFNHIGEASFSTDWLRDETVTAIWTNRLKNSRLSGDRLEIVTHLLSGPRFSADQAEFGKRHALRNTLLD